MSENLVHYQIMPPMAVEFTVDQEILLPDYLPGVFKILSAWMEPDLRWNRLSENRAQLEGSAKLLVLYAADQDDQLHLAEHTAELSKAVELPNGEGEMQISWQIQSCRLTAIPSDRRRIGCRGTVVVRIRQCSMQPQPLPERFDGLECRRVPLEFCCRTVQGSSRFPVRDTLHLGAGEGTPERVIRACAQGLCQDGKVLAGKAVVKGTLRVEVLWYCKQGNLHENTFELSISQIVDLPGLEPEDCIQWQLAVNRCHVRPGEEEDPQSLEVQLEVTASAIAVGKRRLELVEDGYSTRYETKLTTSSASVRQLVCCLHQTGTFRQTLSLQDAGITKLHCVLAKPEPGALLPEEAQVQAMLSVCVVFTDESGVCLGRSGTGSFLAVGAGPGDKANFLSPYRRRAAGDFIGLGVAGIGVLQQDRHLSFRCGGGYRSPHRSAGRSGFQAAVSQGGGEFVGDRQTLPHHLGWNPSGQRRDR